MLPSYQCQLCGQRHIDTPGYRFCPEVTRAMLGRMYIRPVDSAITRDIVMSKIIGLPPIDIGHMARLMRSGGFVESVEAVNLLWKESMVTVLHSRKDVLMVVLHQESKVKLSLYVVAVEDRKGNTEVVTLNQLGVKEAIDYIRTAYPESLGYKVVSAKEHSNNGEPAASD